MSIYVLGVVVTIRYDTIGEFNVDWKAEYSALSSTRSQKKKLKTTNASCRFNCCRCLDRGRYISCCW